MRDFVSGWVGRGGRVGKVTQPALRANNLQV